jgi:hypothetical protein
VVWTEFIWLKIGTSGKPFEHGNEPSGSIKGWIISEQVHKRQGSKKDSVS